MTTITATPNPLDGTVKVSIAKTEVITSLIRADANGTRPVRVPAGSFPTTDAATTITFTDYEAALTGPISYRAGTATPAWTAFAGRMLPRLSLPVQPYLSAWVENVHGYEASRESAATVHYALGRKFPIIVEDVMHSRQGSLTMVVPTHADATVLEMILAKGRTIQLRQAEHAGLDMYFHATNYKAEPEENVWKVSADYVEVDVPDDDLPAAGSWTFATLAALPGADFTTVAQDFDSFAALAQGEKTA